ncbi:uncharacterized protein LOC110830300 [Zootermopsis nevadensis]|uniref:uncharacterized protein LOC110830300 n=1 Tax=Zootermopsis nevadensis TaxID=136037 RepID=UPI000B8E7CA9|nr:uncharacterized protein LOC110830300 [Zootermopsis nevadensis]
MEVASPRLKQPNSESLAKDRRIALDASCRATCGSFRFVVPQFSSSLQDPHRGGPLLGRTWSQALLSGACCSLPTSGACCSDAVPDPIEEDDDPPDDVGASPNVPTPPLRAKGVPAPLPAAAAAAAAKKN